MRGVANGAGSGAPQNRVLITWYLQLLWQIQTPTGQAASFHHSNNILPQRCQLVDTYSAMKCFGFHIDEFNCGLRTSWVKYYKVVHADSEYKEYIIVICDGIQITTPQKWAIISNQPYISK
jgi:hypothetical protein